MKQELKPILIITYYWPPSGGAGVQRWLKFSKYLPEFGWRPIIFTPENPDFDLKDESLLKDVHPDVEVLKFPIWEPYRIFKRLSGNKELKQGQILEGGKQSFFKSLAIWLRGNVFIPDPRIGWVKPSVNYLLSILETNHIRHVITTGPPHSMHLIGARLKMKVPSITWVADFRDPWTQWEILHEMKISKPVWKRHVKLEQQVIKVADSLLVTSPSAKDEFEQLGARRVKVITNGFDESDHIPAKNQEKGRFIISHIGMLSKQRNPDALWSSLDRVIGETNHAVSVKFTGIISPDVLNSINQNANLKGVLDLQESVPHEQVSRLYAESSLLLLIQTKTDRKQTQLPGKLFEYLQARKPILCIGDTSSDLAQIVKETNSGQCFDYEDERGVRDFLCNFLDDRINFSFDSIDRFNRKSLTSELNDFLVQI